MAEKAVEDGLNGADPDFVLETLQGWAAHEAIAAAMFVVARHERDLPGALLEGANAAGDSDSIATLAGALLGARLGLEAIPANWIRDVERSDKLMALARSAATLVGSAPEAPQRHGTGRQSQGEVVRPREPRRGIQLLVA